MSVKTTGDYSVSANTCGTTVLAGKTCTLSIVFKPTAVGVRSGTLTFAEGGTHLQHAIALTGIGAAQATTTSTNSVPPPVTGSTLAGTEGNDRLTLTKNTAVVDGKGGFDIAYLGFVSNDSNPSWYTITKNQDGSYTAFDGHASGYRVTLYGTEELLWPNGQSVMLTTASGTNTSANANPHTADIVGTDQNDSLTAKGNWHVVDGKNGYDTVLFETGNSQLNSSWVAVTKNKDGSYTLQDVHASGFKLTLWNVEAVSFPRGNNIILANVKVSIIDSVLNSFRRTKLGLELAFQSAGYSIRLALTGHPTPYAAVSLSLSPTSLDFGSVPVGSSAVKTITLTGVQR